jgi:hypothetical protein
MGNKGFITYVVCLCIFGFVAIRTATFANQRFDIKWAAMDLVSEQRKMGKETEVNDSKIITAKIFPKSSFEYALNPFIWTLRERSANDDLLQACLDAAERDDAMDAVKYAEDLSTFEDRFKEWEINFEQAKLSLAK